MGLSENADVAAVVNAMFHRVFSVSGLKSVLVWTENI